VTGAAGVVGGEHRTHRVGRLDAGRHLRCNGDRDPAKAQMNHPCGGELRFAVRVRAGARRTAVGGSRDGALVVAVAAPAVDGKANAAVLAAVAEAFGVRVRQVAIVSGERSRDKLIALTAPPQDAPQRLHTLLTTVRTT
jgi:uncharacterized protein